MIAKEVITDEIPPLIHTDSGEKALNWMEEFKVSHLPVLKNGNFVGLVSESDILDKKDPSLSSWVRGPNRERRLAQNESTEKCPVR